MVGRSSPTYLKRKIGRRLREMRERAGMTLDIAAPRLDKTRTSLHRIEVGETLADVHLIRTMTDLYDQRDDELLDLARATKKRAWWYPYIGPRSQITYVDMETEASRARTFHTTAVPGILQTADYIRARFTGARQAWTRGCAENLIAVRRIRKGRLSEKEDPLYLEAVIDESALRRMVGGPEVMREQLSLWTDDLEQVEQAKSVFKQLSAIAPSPEESIRLIEKMLADLPDLEGNSDGDLR